MDRITFCLCGGRVDVFVFAVVVVDAVRFSVQMLGLGLGSR